MAEAEHAGGNVVRLDARQEIEADVAVAAKTNSEQNHFPFSRAGVRLTKRRTERQS